MASTMVSNNQQEQTEAKVSSIQRIYKSEPDEIILRDPTNRRSFINKSAYAKLHRTYSSTNTRHSVDSLKGRFESVGKEEEEKFTPASFGYPKTAKLVPPLIKPKPVVPPRKPPRDVNENELEKDSEVDGEDRIVLQPSASEESVDKIAKELSNFEMDGKPKDRKRVSSIRRFFTGNLFGKDKKKKEEDRNKSVVDNLRNESSFVRQTPYRQTVPLPVSAIQQEIHEEKVKELEQKYAELHVNRFNQIKQSFDDPQPKKRTIDDYISAPVNKYIDTSSSASTESDRPRDTPPRAQETYQNFKMVHPKATIPINSERPLPNPYQTDKNSPVHPKAAISFNSERPLPNPYQTDKNSPVHPKAATSINSERPLPNPYQTDKNSAVHPKAAISINSERPLPNPYQTDKNSPRTIERNLNRSNSKDYPDKATFSEEPDGKLINSPKSPGLETSKLRLPPNREIYDLQPRVRSPIPANRVSTDKIIATELLKGTRSPTLPKRTPPKPPERVVSKPPLSPQKPDRIVTNAVVHTSTPLDNRNYTNITPVYRPITPVEMRLNAARKSSPQKEDIRKSVEEYYWKELKKMKEEEDSKLYMLQANGYYDDPARVRRSRSLSPHRAGKRSMSLPRDGRVPIYIDYSRLPPQQPIPEEQALILDDQARRLAYNQAFIRNSQERRSADSLQRPIFRRGSLTKPEVYDPQLYNKRVSFSNYQAAQQWPTRNGHTQSPPQRRLERMDSEIEDEVFLPPVPRYPLPQEPMYTNRVMEYRPQAPMGSRQPSIDSIPRSREEVYVLRRTDPYLQRNPVYSSRQSMADSIYSQKQYSVRNKYCDIYGQIHDSPNSGIVMGQLQPPAIPRHQSDGFVRGTRLTASANDLGRRESSYENRPLPPPPSRRPIKPPAISDTESGSDASEIQRIMQTKSKSKKRAFFGK